MTERWIHSWTAEMIVEAMGGTLVGSFDRASGVSTDSRTVEEGDLFFALSGEHFDGHGYVKSALERGAIAAVVSKEVDAGIGPVVLVDDVLNALQALARELFVEMNENGVRSVAITGSNGKTTTKEFLRAIIGEQCFATRGNYNNHIGLPLTILSSPLAVDAIVLEMGANKFGDIAELVSIAPTDARVLTSIGAAHLEGFGDLEGVYRAKSEIFGGEGVGLLPRSLADELAERGLLEQKTVETIQSTNGLNEHETQSARDQNYLTYHRTPNQTLAWLISDGRDGEFANPLAGAHNDANLMLALATAYRVMDHLDSQIDVQSRLDAMVLPGGRARRVKAGGHDVYDDAYNANPSSLFASLDAWMEITDDGAEVGRVVVIGDMFELGPDEESIHRDVAKTLGTYSVETLVFVGQFSTAMAESSGRDDALAFSTVEAANAWLKKKEPSRVFLKASRGIKLEGILHGLEQ